MLHLHILVCGLHKVDKAQCHVYSYVGQALDKLNQDMCRYKLFEKRVDDVPERFWLRLDWLMWARNKKYLEEIAHRPSAVAFNKLQIGQYAFLAFCDHVKVFVVELSYAAEAILFNSGRNLLKANLWAVFQKESCFQFGNEHLSSVKCCGVCLAVSAFETFRGFKWNPPSRHGCLS
jgi:hypothetical protein